MKLKIPKSSEETEIIINEVKELFKFKENESYDDIIWESCKDLMILAGSFNHHITYSQRQEMLKILSDNHEQSLNPVLQALIECSRVEQFDLTERYIRNLMKI